MYHGFSLSYEVPLVLLDQAADDMGFRDELAQQYILEQLMADYDPTKPDVRQYLLQHADWRMDDKNSESVTYRAFSDILDPHSGEPWPLDSFNLSVVSPGETGESLSIMAWKGDYETEENYDPPFGSLPYKGPRYTFTGSIWTRG